MSPKTMHHIYNKPNLLKLLLFFNVVNSTIPAVLMSIDFHYFENIAHEFEFVNSFTLSFITMILLASLLNPPSQEDQEEGSVIPTAPSRDEDEKWSSIAMGFVACLVAASNFFVYNAGYHGAAHYLEFSFNIIISLVTFWFCMDSRFMSQMEIGQILYGKHQNCIFCQMRTNDLESQMQRSSKFQNMFGDPDGPLVNPIRGALGVNENRLKRVSLPKKSSNQALFREMEEEEERHANISERTPLLNDSSGNSTTGTVTDAKKWSPLPRRIDLAWF